MFANQRGSAGLGSIIGVAAVAALYLASAGLMLKTYREGGSPKGENVCQVACHPKVVKSGSRG